MSVAPTGSFPHARFRLLAVLLTALAVLFTALSLSQPARAADAGTVQFVKRTGPEFDSYTRNPTASFSAWMNTKFWRSEVFTPYFDNKTSWYKNGWVYEDSYAIDKCVGDGMLETTLAALTALK